MPLRPPRRRTPAQGPSCPLAAAPTPLSQGTGGSDFVASVGLAVLDVGGTDGSAGPASSGGSERVSSILDSSPK